MSGLMVGRVLALDLPRTAKLVLAVLAEHAHDDGEEAFPSVPTIAREAGCSARTARYWLRALREAGIIVAVRNAKGGRGRARDDGCPHGGAPVVYRLELPVVGDPRRSRRPTAESAARARSVSYPRKAAPGGAKAKAAPGGAKAAPVRTLRLHPGAAEPSGEPSHRTVQRAVAKETEPLRERRRRPLHGWSPIGGPGRPWKASAEGTS